MHTILAPDVIGSVEPQTHASASERRKRWFEVFLVLLIACGGALLSSFYLLANGPGAAPHASSNARWIAGIVHEISSLLLLGYVLSRRGLSVRSLGLRWSIRGIGMGLLLGVFSYAAYALGSMVVQVMHLSLFGSAATGPTARDFYAHPAAAAIPFSLLNPFFEELIVRAYVMTEAVQLTGSSALAVALSVAVQFSYHLYYGWIGALSLAFIFLLFALYYARTRSALPIIVAHGFVDIYALLRLW